MDRQPNLFDPEVVARSRRRSQALEDPALFLQRHAVDEIQERLTIVNKAFTDPAIVTGWPQAWAPHFPKAKSVPDSETIALAERAHDLVVHAMALHWANDPVGQLIQCRRALRADGLFLGCLFGGQTLAQLRAVLAEAETDLTGGLSPRIAPMAEIRDLGGLMQRAGFALPVADSVQLNVTYRDAFHLMHDLRAMGETNALHARLRRPTRRAIFLQAAHRYAAAYSTENGRIQATFEIIFLTGWAPDPSQPQPLRPGSATARLSDVLGTQETKLIADD